jgi:TatD DNase family protein
MFLIDTHSHLFLKEFDNDLDAVIKRSVVKGIKHIILPNIDSTSIDRLINTCKSYPGICIPAMGLHPTSVKEDYEKELAIVQEFLEKNILNSNNKQQTTNNYFCAIGETGIDLYWDKTYFEQQKISFLRQVDLALKYNLPIIIHSRNSLNEIFELLDSHEESLQSNNKLKGIFHCFPGNLQQAEKVISLGLMLGIGGVITFKNSGLQEVVKNIDLKHIVLETDSPYLAPDPFRGKRNESAYIYNIAMKIAQIKNISFDEVAEVTSQNAMNLFRIPNS